ncbi:MAG: nicotinate-nucleotide diphosphorylase (carboxylating) [Gallionellales bacterium RIFCSPLOWO2_02_FULL_57_47]|nr:MAG: nicotinate-nucleotide diphosphorylase (carboxylating) [Gallionellales bacterium RIFCSPLOWO2_02_FULL_57_47]OGT17157.1 MAG: nicotinate-nucleotide diphosphorylase (carboxylating) [Gallionellales bacterium RIFCSPHIGHO2_02_FULL_57_16]
MLDPELAPHIRLNVANSLNEDVFTGDLTAQLLPPALISNAQVITRQHGVLCGTQWFDECFRMQSPDCAIDWLAKDGDWITPGQLLCEIRGKAQALLTAERSALNLLQTLSATATRTKRYVDAVAGLDVKIMDTRKTLPGLRHAQKYAVRMGGGHNQRAGLFDGILIKENHIVAAGGIRPVLEHAFRLATPGISVQIEVESLAQLDEALLAGAKLVLLDNFGLAELRAAVRHTAGRAELEASGGITLDKLREVALTGVNRISIGALTKDIEALDLSMRITS